MLNKCNTLCLPETCDPSCKQGKMCIKVDNDYICDCPTECDEEEEPHCSVFLKDYQNLCEVHRHACRMQINVAVKHKGKCGTDGFYTLTLSSTDEFPYIL